MTTAKIQPFHIDSTKDFTFGNTITGNLKTDNLLYANGVVMSFATSAQGTKADTAVQPGDLATVATTGSYSDLLNKPTLFDGTYANLTGKPTLGTAAATNANAYATAAQGLLADSALQPSANFSFDNSTKTLSVDNITMTGNLLPSANITYNIGSPTQRFKDIFLSGNTIDLAGATIKTDGTTGAIALIPQPTVSTPNPTALVITTTGALATITTTGGVANISQIGNAVSNYATETYVNTQISNLIDSAPATLNTLNELAAALGDDANFATTITASIGNKLSTSDFTSTANTWLGTKSTTDVAEGTNLYYTETRANTAIDARVTKTFVDNLSVVANIANIAYSVLGDISNISILGGSANYVLSTDGAGNLSWVEQTGGTGSSSPAITTVDTFTGDGNTITYTLSLTPATVKNVTVNYNGEMLLQGTYTLSGDQITFGSAPALGAVFDVIINETAVISGGYYDSNVASYLPTYTGVLGGTISTASQPNITSVGILSSLVVTANITSGNVIGGNLVTANYISGNGSLLTSITGANVSGTVASATTAGTVTTAAQPNITSVGTLSSLNVSGNVTANYIIGNGSQLTHISGTNVDGQVANALIATTITANAQPNITSVGTLTSLTVTANVSSGNITGGNLVSANYFSGNGSLLTSIAGANVSGAVTYATTANSVAAANVTGQVSNALVSGTVYTNSQPNITSTGTLTSLAVSGTSTFTGSVTTKYVDETIQTKSGATGVVTHDLTSGTTFYHTTPSANFTANFTNVSTTNDRVVVSALIITQGATPYVPTAVQIDGTAQTIKWMGGTAPTGNASKTDIISFSLLRTGSAWIVFGQSADFS